MKQLKKADVLIIGIVLALAATIALCQESGQTATGSVVADIYVAGELYESIPLVDGFREISVQGVGGVAIVCVEPDGVSVSDSDCPGKICQSFGKIRASGQTIACLPLRMLVVLRGAGGRDGMGYLDAVSG